MTNLQLQRYLQTLPNDLLIGISDINYQELFQTVDPEDVIVTDTFILFPGTSQEYVD